MSPRAMEAEGHYYPRVVDGHLRRKLASAGALVMEGSRGCGKTATAERVVASSIDIQDPDYREYYIEQARAKPSLLLEGEAPRLIDEWQDIPKLWDAVRFAVDRNPGARYILAGSVLPREADAGQMKHSGTGRISKVRMRTMSLFESGDSNGEVSLKGLFDGETGFDSISDMTPDGLAFVMRRGGWPESMGMSGEEAMEVSKDRYRSIVSGEISCADGVKRDPMTVDSIMRILSGCICAEKSMVSIAEDAKVVSRLTVMSYIEALRRLFVVEDIPAWRPALKSKARLVASPKRCLCDPSLATAALGSEPDDLFRNMGLFGSLFEALAIRDLRVYSQVIDGQVYHYHDTTGLEVDAIVSLADGRWCAIEIKLNSGEDEGARNLIRFRNKTRLADGTGPSFLAVLTGTGFYHVRPDGVLVIPIGCLGP